MHGNLYEEIHSHQTGSQIKGNRKEKRERGKLFSHNPRISHPVLSLLVWRTETVVLCYFNMAWYRL